MKDNSRLDNEGQPAESACKSCGNTDGKFETMPFTGWFFNYRVKCKCGHTTKYVSDPYCAEDYFSGALT